MDENFYKDMDKYRVKREDGSDYVAMADVMQDFQWSDLSYDRVKYVTNGDMTRYHEEDIGIWRLDTYYDSRNLNGWENWNIYADLHEFIKGKLKKEETNIDIFKNLYDMGYLIPTPPTFMENEKNPPTFMGGAGGGDDIVNLVVTTTTPNELIALLPDIPDKLKEIIAEYQEEIYGIEKAQYPPRMHDLCRLFCSASVPAIKARVLEQLLANGILKPPTEDQKKTLNTIMFGVERLPNVE